MKQNRLSLTVNYQGPPLIIDNEWLRLEQVGLKPETASIGEAADLVDAAYRTDPCQTPAAAGPVDQGEFREIVRQKFDLSLCDTNPNGDTRAQIRIISSNPDAPYGLRFSGPGTVVQTVVVAEEISLRLKVENSDSIVLPWPVTGNADFSWAGSVFGPGGMIIAPEITRSGNTLSFAAPLTGIIAATYQTRYRLVDVVVTGDAECRALCFSMGLVAELDIQRPESQSTLSDWQKYCNPQNKWVFPVPDITCYEEVEKSWRCECDTAQENRSVTVKETVPCPDGFAEWGMEPGEYKIGDRYEIAGYEYCPDLQTHPWAEDISDPDYYTQICCNPPPKGLSLPTCKTKTSANPGGVPIENGADYYTKLYGPGTKIVPVSPADGDCGTMETIQDVIQKNCCDGVAPIYWDYDNSAEVIADNSKGLVEVTGGQAPYTWQIRGSGFWADAAHTARDVQTDVPYLWIYTENSCGPCDVYVTDGCSSASAIIRSDIGSWKNLEYTGVPCLINIDCGQATIGLDYDPKVNTCVQGKYKIVEYWQSVGANCGASDQITATLCADGAVNPNLITSCAYSGVTGDWFPCAGSSNLWYNIKQYPPLWWCGSGIVTNVGGSTTHAYTTPYPQYYEWTC